MTDKELLELAAKAAGLDVWTCIDGNYYTSNNVSAELPWSPLTDDGDALRLAVKLSMNVYVNAGFLVSAEITNDSDEPSIVANEYGKQDPYAATRRAIVRAAAEIGKTL